MKHLSIYEDYDLLRDLTKLGINEVKWDAVFINATPSKLEYAEHEIANEWTYKNLRFASVSMRYSDIETKEGDILEYRFSVTLNSSDNRQSTKNFTIFVLITSPDIKDNPKHIVTICGGHVIQRNQNPMKESSEFAKELIEGYGKEAVLPYALKVFESIL